jgi:hypothetical protein
MLRPGKVPSVAVFDGQVWSTRRLKTKSPRECHALKFQATIEINGINPYVRVSAVQAGHLRAGWRKPLPVRVRVNGQPETPWRINLMPVGDGSFYLYLHGQVREASGTAVGDVVEVEVAFDETYQPGPAHPMPVWFAEALDTHPAARQVWEALAPSRRKEILRYFSQLKSAEAQARNLQLAIHVLSGGPGRFMARSWNVESDA